MTLLLQALLVPMLMTAPVTPSPFVALDIPAIRQTPEHCGQAALEMVLRWYEAPASALRETETAYDPALRGSLITDLGAAARRAGFDATIETLTPDQLVELLVEGVPPIVLFQAGTGLLTRPHFGVLTGWNAAKATFTLNDGASAPRRTERAAWTRRWESAGSQALIVRRRAS